MEDLIKWIIENKELVLFASISIAIGIALCINISIPIKFHFGKTEINKIINNNGNTGKGQGEKNHHSKKQKKTEKKNTGNNQGIKLLNTRLYAVGIKGRVYTKEFRKLIIHNFGIEISLINNSNVLQNVNIKWCICSNGAEIENRTCHKRINAHQRVDKEFYVEKQVFKQLRSGQYDSKLLINNRIVKKECFTIMDK